jgi:hypothetical protein
VTAPRWSAAGLVVDPGSEHHRDFGVLVRPCRGAALRPELARSLRDWLSWWLGETPPPADPDRVRLVIDEQRAALAARSVEACTEDFRAGLAWAEHALDAIAEAAS